MPEMTNPLSIFFIIPLPSPPPRDSVGVKRALHCNAKLTFDDHIMAVFDSTAKATADDLLATLEVLAVLREEFPVALDNAGGEMCKLSRPRNGSERCSNSRGAGSTEDSRPYTDGTQRDVDGEEDNQQPMASKRCDTGGGNHDSSWYSVESRSTARDEIDEPTTDLDRGNTSMADFGGWDSYASDSPLSDSQAPPHEKRGGSGTSHAHSPLHPPASTRSRQTSEDMSLTLVDALGDGSNAREGSVDRLSSAANEASLYDAPSVLVSSQGSPTSALKVAQSRVTSDRASSGSDGAKERHTAPQHPEPETRRLGPDDMMERVQAALQHVDSDSETVFQVNDVFDDVNAKPAPPDHRKVERKVSTLRRGESWECKRCTFINEIYSRCGMCGAARPREEYHLRSIRPPVPRFSEYKTNQGMGVEGSRRSIPLADAQSGDLVDDDASSQNKQTKRKTMNEKRAVGRPRREKNGVGSGNSNGAASEAGVGSTTGRRWTVQVSSSPSSDGRVGPSSGNILRVFAEWAASSDPSPFTLDTSILAEVASRELNDTKVSDVV